MERAGLRVDGNGLLRMVGIDADRNAPIIDYQRYAQSFLPQRIVIFDAHHLYGLECSSFWRYVQDTMSPPALLNRLVILNWHGLGQWRKLPGFLTSSRFGRRSGLLWRLYGHYDTSLKEDEINTHDDDRNSECDSWGIPV